MTDKLNNPSASAFQPEPIRRPGIAATRRGALAALGVCAAASRTVVAAPNPDADLIRICAEHVANIAAYNRDGGRLNCEDDPLWAACERTLYAIDDADPQTMEGILAIARAAKSEAQMPNGVEDPANCPAADWAWCIVNDLLRLYGGQAA
ncbi:hypothetical protein ACQW02_25640 [Humitalea sp. 24SJ18S-53]|uniref:hypothetical protein n=1 Tax=Humitalea sp. 24SJ18S-53 TaxID=3422307 RepID=UPI003D66D880